MAESRVRRYAFHGVVALEVESDDPRALAYFDAEYGWAAGRPEAPVAVRLRWGGGVPEGVAVSHKALARWRYRLEAREDRLEIMASGNRFALPMVHHMLVHPGLRLHASRRGVLLLHAAAVVHAGRSLLLTGPGGTGKTTTSSLLLAAGPDWLPHADDYVFLAPGPRTLAYLTRSHLYHDLLAWVPELRARLRPGERLRVEFFGRIRKWSGRRIQWAVRLPPERLWPGRPPVLEAPLGALVVLARAAIGAPTLGPVEAVEPVLENLLDMNFYEARHFRRLVLRATGKEGLPPWWRDWQDRERELLRARLLEARLLQLTLPVETLPDHAPAARALLESALEQAGQEVQRDAPQPAL